MGGTQHHGGEEYRTGAWGRVLERLSSRCVIVRPSSRRMTTCQHVLDGLPDPLVIHVSRSLECGSMAVATAVHTIRRVAHRYPSWSRECWMCSFRSSSRSGMNAIPALRHCVTIGSRLHTSGHGQHLTARERMPARGLEAHTTGTASLLC